MKMPVRTVVMTAAAALLPRASLLVVAALAAAACNGGGGHTVVAPTSFPLTVGKIGDVSVAQDTVVGPVAVPVYEGPAAFTVMATSSDTTLLPPGSIRVQSGTSPAITLTPAEGAVGTAVISVTATDPQGQSAQLSFNVTFNAVYASFAALALGTFAESDTAAPVPVVGKTYLDDADDPSTFASLLQ